MTRRKPRNLTADEKALWNRIADQAVPLHPARKAPGSAGPPGKTLTVKDTGAGIAAETQAPPLTEFRLGQNRTETAPRHDLAPSMGTQLATQQVRMDRKSFGRMRRGKLSPDARIDLHGMTLAQAHPTLIRFVSDAYARDRRLVLVITGKGRGGGDDGPVPQRRGILKHQVPHWLQSPPLSSMVLQITEAHLKHGGSGAYYVYLRRRR